MDGEGEEADLVRCLVFITARQIEVGRGRGLRSAINQRQRARQFRSADGVPTEDGVRILGTDGDAEKRQSMIGTYVPMINGPGPPGVHISGGA